MSCLCLLQSISCPAGGERCGKPPTCSGAPAVDSPQTEPVDSPSVTYESLSSRVNSELCSSAWRLHPWIPDKRKTVCVCVQCVSAYQVGVQLLSGSKQHVRCCWVWTLSVGSWCESKGHGMTELLFCYHNNNALDVVIFEYWKHPLHKNDLFFLL